MSVTTTKFFHSGGAAKSYWVGTIDANLYNLTGGGVDSDDDNNYYFAAASNNGTPGNGLLLWKFKQDGTLLASHEDATPTSAGSSNSLTNTYQMNKMTRIRTFKYGGSSTKNAVGIFGNTVTSSGGYPAPTFSMYDTDLNRKSFFHNGAPCYGYHYKQPSSPSGYNNRLNEPYISAWDDINTSEFADVAPDGSFMAGIGYDGYFGMLGCMYIGANNTSSQNLPRGSGFLYSSAANYPGRQAFPGNNLTIEVVDGKPVILTGGIGVDYKPYCGSFLVNNPTSNSVMPSSWMTSWSGFADNQQMQDTKVGTSIALTTSLSYKYNTLYTQAHYSYYRTQYLYRLELTDGIHSDGSHYTNYAWQVASMTPSGASNSDTYGILVHDIAGDPTGDYFYILYQAKGTYLMPDSQNHDGAWYIAKYSQGSTPTLQWSKRLSRVKSSPVNAIASNTTSSNQWTGKIRCDQDGDLMFQLAWRVSSPTQKIEYGVGVLPADGAGISDGTYGDYYIMNPNNSYGNTPVNFSSWSNATRNLSNMTSYTSSYYDAATGDSFRTSYATPAFSGYQAHLNSAATKVL